MTASRTTCARTRLAVPLLLAGVVLPMSGGGVSALTLVPEPGQAGYDPMLEAKAEAYNTQIHELMTVSVGWGLEAFVSAPAARTIIDDFFTAGATDFEAYSGMHAYDVISDYGEFGDLGMFGGVQAAGDAFRYAVLRDGGAPAPLVDAARADVLRALDGLHWYTQVTGVPGLVARGIRRITPEAGDPPLPGTLPATTPLFDGMGNPLPPKKEPTWRDDASGELPFLMWLDDCSKDQMDGYIFALGAMYDVVVDDSDIPAALVTRLGDDALAIGRKLMERVEVAPGMEADLVIQDADGRVTTFHDMSAEEVTAGAVFPTPINGFNGWMGLGVMRTLYHITGDEEIGRFYYEDLVGSRDYFSVIEQTLRFMYGGTATNFSNVNMAFVAAYGILRYESDPAIGDVARRILEDELYAPGVNRDADDSGQSFFDFIYAAFRVGGVLGPGEEARAEGNVTLAEFPDPPYWNDLVINCDAAEEASLDCIGVDGTPLPLSATPGRGGSLVALAPVPMRIRPPSNFEWRSDPHRVNDGGGDRLNPGGGFHCAYWMGRYLEESLDPYANVSPNARPAPPPLPGSDGGIFSDAGADAGARDDDPGSGGCGCRIAASSAEAGRAAPLLLLCAGVALVGRVGRERRRERVR